jgi:Flp pilus assembly protein TadD
MPISMKDLHSSPISRFRRGTIVLVFLAILIAAAYWPVLANGFVYDDETYLLRNSHVQAGINAADMGWAFTTIYAGNWHPLTWVSLQADNQVFGMKPWGYHLTNVLLHLGSVCLLFGLFLRLTGCFWPSVWVAVLFAVHPIHVESVAWVTERKDVLSGLFFIAALWCYAAYARRPGITAYALVHAFLTLSLMAKPMLVTAPAVFLLFDYWPLGRIDRSNEHRATSRCPPISFARALLEKVPIALLALGVGLATLKAQRPTIRSLEAYTPVDRVENALVSYIVYIAKMLWPTDLAPFYPHLGPTLSSWQWLASGLAIAAITALGIYWARRRPYFLAGWLWYLVMLLPVIGLIQVGRQAMADRYAYLPLIGIYWIIGFGVAEIVRNMRLPTIVPILAVVVILVACGLLTRRQVHYWHDSITLWRHTAQVTSRNYLAHYNLGVALQQDGKFDDALDHFRQAIRFFPQYADALNNCGALLERKGDFDKAADHYAKALQADPNDAKAAANLAMIRLREGKVAEARSILEQGLSKNPEAGRLHFCLGILLDKEGNREAATVQFAAAVQAEPGNTMAFQNWAMALRSLGKREDAIAKLRAATQLEPRNLTIRACLAALLKEAGHLGEADTEFTQVLQEEPRWLEVANGQAWYLATTPEKADRDGSLAIVLAQEVCSRTNNSVPRFLDTLAAAYAETGQFQRAAQTIQNAIDLGRASENLRQAMQDRLLLYQQRQPFRSDPGRP